MSNKKRLFKNLLFTTIIAVYLLIFVGGIVRSTGSGMGCPDWPKCFGQIIPPTSLNQLPENYKQLYASKRHEKNVKFSKLIASLGFKDYANKIISDKSILVEEDFNVLKTWIEYINRLIGALIGLLIFLTFISAVYGFMDKKSIPLMSFGSVLLVGFQGWIGSIVVSTKLLPGMVSVHMSLALLLVLLLIYTYFKAHHSKSNFTISYSKIRRLSIILLIMFAVQIILGTQVREGVDLAAINLGNPLRHKWIDSLGMIFKFHRSYSLVIIAVTGYLAYLTYKKKLSQVFKFMSAILLLVLLETVGGTIMAYFSIPAFIQPFHLVISTIIFGLLYYVFLLTSKNNIIHEQSTL
ncbi:MAG TPA: heme A synthase [Cyclobacteriaceae bacterium]